MDFKKLSDLYVFMAQISLSEEMQNQISNNISSKINIQNKLEELLSFINKPEEIKAIKFSLMKDIVRISKLDNFISISEEKVIKKIASLLYETEEEQEKIINFAKEAVDNDKKLI